MEEKKGGPVVVANPWGALREVTPARIALGRTGISLPTQPHLEFQLAHAKARSAVHRELDAAALAERLTTIGEASTLLQSRAPDRATYLQRPDAGRRLDDASRARLADGGGTPVDLAIVVGDGLSAFAVEENAFAFMQAFLPLADARGWTRAPAAIVRQARVAIGDEVGELLGARMAVVLIGERPGLSSPDSLGLYMTLGPKIGLTDEARNCISNVRAAGMLPQRAAEKLAYLIDEAFRRNLSGVALKDQEEPAEPLPSSAGSFLTRG